MPLSCSCDFDYEPGSWFCEHPADYSTLETAKRRRCSSCGDLIDIGATVAKFPRWRVPETFVEVNIFGEDGQIPLAPSYFCERCADLFFSLAELGFECITPTENMVEMVKEYAETYGPKVPADDWWWQQLCDWWLVRPPMSEIRDGEGATAAPGVQASDCGPDIAGR